MKYLLFTISLLILVLSSCANVPPNVQVNAPTATLAQSPQQNTPTESATENSITVNISELPRPNDSRIIGSVTVDGTKYWYDYMLTVDTSLSQDSAHEFYASKLKDKGWMASPLNEGGGIIASPESDFYKAYCYGVNEVFLSVETESISAETTRVRLRLDTNPDDWCSAEFPAIYLVPPLRPPQGVAYVGGTADSDVGYGEMTADLKGDLSAAEVIDFYNEQLFAAGWEMQNGGYEAGSAWSNWTFKDKEGRDWIGSLRVDKESSKSDTLFASMRVEKIK